MKRCRTCREILPLSEFTRDDTGSKRDCKACRAEQERIRYGSDPVRHRRRELRRNRSFRRLVSWPARVSG